jgi:hypothetical protein
MPEMNCRRLHAAASGNLGDLVNRLTETAMDGFIFPLRCRGNQSITFFVLAIAKYSPMSLQL